MQSEMTAAAATEIIQLLESAAIEAWLDGGWAVDAILGHQTRSHKDLDIILHSRDLPKLQDTLSGKAFAIQPGGTPSNFVLANQSGLQVDVHAIRFDGHGNGVYEMANGQKWIFPASGFSGRGVIGGIEVRCLSAEVQVLCHAHGYVPAEKDFQDMALLELRFGVELPPNLRRDGIQSHQSPPPNNSLEPTRTAPENGNSSSL